MRNSEPPRLATWVLERLAPRHRRESLVGDLREQFHRGRSAWWYRRQVFGTILVGLVSDVASHRLLALRALALGWLAVLSFSYVIHRLSVSSADALQSMGIYALGRLEILRQLWVYYGVPFVLATGVIFMTVGWMVAALHRRRLPGIIVLFSATLLIPAIFQALETRRLLETELWPGWGWGSFRWALLFHTSVAFVLYPICALIGGLWRARPEDGSECEGSGTEPSVWI